MNQSNHAKQTWVVANWKMNPVSSAQVTDLMQGLAQNLQRQEIIADNSHVVIAPSLVHLSQVIDFVDNHALSMHISAQNVCANHAENGAFTGEISASMLKELGVKSVIIGHSERRQYYGETDESLTAKIQNAFNANLSVIYCIGETKDEYDNGETETVLQRQLALLASFAKNISLVENPSFPKLIVAYEPVWAIGTGLTPTFDEVANVHHFISELLSTFKMPAPILYGGSVNDKNANDLAKIPLVDGVLVGGASLKVDSFCEIITAFAKK
ncbi:triose-phosphate isomerase [Faucicola boevrei]|uniref:triose-phosphate isomerase n=1 Tax=Faucicola boevrei TaxID=346665 RepID=UPI00036F5F04|nr:triose-phosphate isomerase [Moraxella boevrei]